MSKRYEYENRIILEFSNGKRASYSRKRYGCILEEIVKQSMILDKKIFNPIEEQEECIEILYFLKSKRKIIKIYVDKEMYFTKELWQYYWRASENNSGSDYPNCILNYGETVIKLHHLISDISLQQIKDGLVVDHIDHNVLNNRRNNLRIVTTRENSTNLSNQLNMGVNKTFKGKGWRARWSLNGKNFSKGFYGEDAFERATEYRLKKIKECGYLCSQ